MARKNTKKRMTKTEAIEPDLLTDEFFMDLPAVAPTETWDDEPDEKPKLAPKSKRAMWATLTIFSVFALAVGGFVFYSKVIMPTPVQLGAPSTYALPQAPAYVPQPVSQPVIAPVAAPPVAEPIVAATTIEAAPAPAVAEPAHAEPIAAPEPVVMAAVATPAPTPAAPEQRAVVARAEPRPRARKPEAAAPPSIDANSLGAQAMRALNGGHPADARRLAQQAVQQNPERADGWIVLGAASDALGDHAAAKAAYASCTARAFGPRVATCRALAR
jgi:hypothetical protein